MGEERSNLILKWETHNNDLLRELELQRKAKQFTDVTLDVGDASFVAHRVVLSACSTYFSNILNRLSDCPHPVIVLRDTSPRQMKALLDYMYTGEMSVKQEDLQAITNSADSLGIQLSHPKLSPLATSEHLALQSGLGIKDEATTAIGSRPLSGMREGRKGYRPKRIRTSPDSGNMSGSNVSSDANIASPDSFQDRSYPSCPSRGSNESPNQNYASHDENNALSAVKEDDHERPKVTIAKNLHESPMDYSKPESLPQLSGPGMNGANIMIKDKKATMSVLDSYLRYDQDKSAGHSPGSLSSLAHSLGANPTHLAAAQNLAWLSQQNFRSGVSDITKSSDQDSDKENRLTPSSSSVPAVTSSSTLATGLPTLSMDMASRLQNAFWAANFNRDSPYSNWMNPSVNPGLAAVAAAAAAAINTTSNGLSSTTPSSSHSSSSMLGHSHTSFSSPNSYPDPSVMAGSMETSSFAGNTGSSGRGRGKGRPSSSMTPPAIGPNGKPMVKCDICGKTLADPSSLYRHRKIHSGDKPHKCPYCGRLFIQRYNMTQHIKTHFKERGINSLSANGITNLTASSNDGEDYQQQGNEDTDMNERGNNGEEDEEEGVEDEEEEIEPC